jgi:hypothetical protein
MAQDLHGLSSGGSGRSLKPMKQTWCRNGESQKHRRAKSRTTASSNAQRFTKIIPYGAPMITIPNLSRRAFLSGLAITLGSPSAFAQAVAKPALQFDNVRFIHRWSKDGQHEFTPEGEDNLAKWTHMVTINRHPAVKNADQLTEIANRTVENYRRNGLVMKTSSKPPAAGRTVEHLAVAVMGRPEFIEAAFTRFILANGTGFALTYSHRINERTAGPKMSAWFSANAQRKENALLGWADNAALAAYSSA